MKLTKIELVTLAQTAQRLGLSRGKGFESVSARTTRSAWNEAWGTARKIEQVFPPLNVVEAPSSRSGMES